MNELKIKEVQQKALRRAKAEVARLNDELNKARFWHDVAEAGIVSPERIEQVKHRAYKRVKYAVIGISIAVILTIVLSGCQTLRGATGDSAWMLQKLSDNISIEKEK